MRRGSARECGSVVGMTLRESRPLLAVGGALCVAVGMLVVAVALKASRPMPLATTAMPASLPAQPVPAAPAPTVACGIETIRAARLRDRSLVTDCITRALNALAVMNGGERSVVAEGWTVEESLQGPPCAATFVYRLHGNRRNFRFGLWPGNPPRIATDETEAHSLGDLCSVPVLGGSTSPTEQQLAIATLYRIAAREYIEDAFMDPIEPDTLTVRRGHCVAENVDMSRDANALRLYRNAGIRRVRCVSDANWTLDIPARGRVGEPYLPEAP